MDDGRLVFPAFVSAFPFALREIALASNNRHVRERKERERKREIGDCVFVCCVWLCVEYACVVM